MAQYVRRDPLREETGFLNGRASNSEIQTLSDVGSGHCSPITVGQQGGHAAKHWVQPQPGAYLHDSTSPQRHRPQLAPLAVQMDAGGAVEDAVDHAHPNDLGDPRAGERVFPMAVS